MLTAEQRETLERKIRNLVQARGFYFVDLEERYEKGQRVLSIVIHREPSVTVSDCEHISRAVEPLLDAEEWLTGSYILEVSSPGLERVLRRREEFQIFSGRLADITFDHEGKVETVRAYLWGLDGEEVIVEKEGNYYRIGLPYIRRAKLVFEEGRKKHGGKRRKK
ncbi:ribosome maturation factor [Coprothermobacteraceae bacterium]|nr:ribosome maturation factor [Coprothermobacteraceae bacterium]